MILQHVSSLRFPDIDVSHGGWIGPTWFPDSTPFDREDAADIDLSNIPECQKYLDEGAAGRPQGELEVTEGLPEGGKIHDLTGRASAFAPDYAPEEMFEIATKLTNASR